MIILLSVLVIVVYPVLFWVTFEYCNNMGNHMEKSFGQVVTAIEKLRDRVKIIETLDEGVISDIRRRLGNLEHPDAVQDK